MHKFLIYLYRLLTRSLHSRAYLPLLGGLSMTGIVLLVDLGTKYLAHDTLMSGQPIVIFPGFNLSLVFNYNAVFGINYTESSSLYLLLITLIIMSSLTLWLSDITYTQQKERLGICLLSGGALGNILNLFYSGYVIDFFSIYSERGYWPIFNVADIAICVGAFLVISSLWHKKRISA